MMNVVDLTILGAELPHDLAKCVVHIHVDRGPNPVRTKPAKNGDWQERFTLPARTDSVLRFELKRKSFLRQQLLAFADVSVSDLVHHVGDLPIPLSSVEKQRDQWRLLVRLHGTRDLGDVTEQRRAQSIESSLASIVSSLETFIAVGDAISQLNPYANVAWKTVTAFYTIIRGQVDRNARLEDLTGLMKDCYAFVDTVKSFPEKIPALESTIRSILSQTVECTIFLRECSGHGFGQRLALGAWTDRHINDFMQSFTTLKQSLETGTSIQTALVCFRLDDNVHKLLDAQTLSKLAPAHMSDPLRSECLPNTRMDVLANIFSWAVTPSVDCNVFWLHGFPGSGKSTISTSIANIFRELRRLGAFVFFTRSVAARNDPALLICTLAHQLAEFDHRIGTVIAKVIEDVPSIKQAPLRSQFQKLLVEPFAALEHALEHGPILVVIDALDECGQSDGREELLRILASETLRLPSTIRFFITSRREKDILSAFSGRSHVLACELDIQSPANEKDVWTYIHHRMVDIRTQNEWLQLPPDWPGTARIDALALRASGLFVWASTACRYIEKGQDPEERLSQLVRTAVYADVEAALDGIYVTALESAGKWDDDAFATDFADIMGLVIVAENPVTSRTIDILNDAKRPCLHTIRSLCTVLQSEIDHPICVMHPSFADFITDKRRCRSDLWFVDRAKHHLRVARLCIARLGKVLKKNVYGLTLSTTPWKVDVPEDVAYSVRYWVDHLCQSVGDEAVAEPVLAFLRVHFLHWVEVMTTMGKARQTIGSMTRLKAWVDTYCPDDNALVEFTKDAVRFCQCFTHVYEQHPLLVYQSALPFTLNNTVFKTFKDDDPDVPVVVGGFREHWSPLLIEIGHQSRHVAAIAYSPDGRCIASTNGQSISVWDATSGELITRPMLSEKSDFTSIAFSPNNVHIASGATDGVVRLWDASSGNQVAALRGHTGPVYGLVFSSDARVLVSASKDQTIVVWDADDGSMTHGPLTGHRKTILALAFSPVGTRFASGSRDRSIRIWDAVDGRQVCAIAHYGGGVTALAYTPDGNTLVSGSDDRSIRVWDANEGTQRAHPRAPSLYFLAGHKSDVYSLAVSSRVLASASKDTTVRLWDLATGSEYGALVRQHRLPVRTVVFSPDGDRLVTGSVNDGTVRVWDVESVGSMGGTRLHKGLVSDLAFSEDGTRLVSGGFDRTVRVWCTASGRPLLEPVRLEREVSRVGFGKDGRIFGVDREGAVVAWDERDGVVVVVKDDDLELEDDNKNTLVLEGRWIVATEEDGMMNDGGQVLGYLPNMSPVKARTSFRNTIAIGLANGSIVIVRFPAQY